MMQQNPSDIDELFQDMIHAHWRPREGEPWIPPVDLYETAAGFWITVDLPGVEAEGIEIRHLGKCSLLLCGIRSVPISGESGQFLVSEREWKRFIRRLDLTCSVDLSRKTVHSQNGICRFFLPKAGVQPLLDFEAAHL